MSVHAVTTNLNDLYWLIDIQYENNKLVGRFLRGDNKIVKMRMVSNHKPYLLTSDVRAKSDASVIECKEIEIYDGMIQAKRKLLKACVREPRDIYDKYTNSGLRLRLSETWEDDIPYHLCYTWDNKLVFGLPYKLNRNGLHPVYGSVVDIVKKERTWYKNQWIREFFTKWLFKVVSAPLPQQNCFAATDIEVQYGTLDSKGAPNKILCISYYDGNKALILTSDKTPITSLEVKGVKFNIISFESEKDMLRHYFEYVLDKPFIVTFGGDNYDLPYIRERGRLYGLELPLNIVPSNYGREFESDFLDRIHIDLYKLFTTGLLMYVYRGIARPNLDDCATAILGEGKLEQPNFDKITPELLRYCMWDSILTYKIVEANDYAIMNILWIIARIYGMPLTEVARTYLSWMNETLFKYMHRLVGYLIPNRKTLDEKNKLKVVYGAEEGSKYRGAIIDSLPGIYFKVRVYDFRSLYPGVIDSFNLSYETIGCPHEECKNNKVPEHDFHVCKKYKGIVSAFIGAVRDVRAYFKVRSRDKRLYKAISGALKICLLSHYGLYGMAKSNYFLLPLASATTGCGRNAIMTALKKARDLGLLPVYTHTDSLWIKMTENDEDKCKQLLEYVYEKTGVELDLEKEYRYVIVSKKANCLGVLPDGTVDIKGLVGKKRHVAKFLKDAFNELVDILSKATTYDDVKAVRSKIIDAINKRIKMLKDKKVPLEDLAFKVLLNKPPTEGKGQDYDVAMQYIRRGIPKKMGDFILKVKTIGPHSAKPLEFTTWSEVNIDKYIEDLLSIVSQITEPLDISIEDIMTASYKKLDKFKSSDAYLNLEFKDKSNDLSAWMSQ